MKILVFLIGMIFLSDIYACNYNIDAENSLASEDSINRNLDSKISVWTKEYNVPTVGVGIIEDGKIVYAKVYGKNINGDPAPDNTIFNMASITKTITTILTLKLVESGNWSLDEPLAAYWVDPDVKDDPFHKKLTTRHVLTHQTGFANWRWNNPDNKLKFDFEPGTDYNYSGEGFVYLQKAIERKLNKTFSDLIDSLLFTPIGMKDSRMAWDDEIKKESFAFWYNTEGKLHEEAFSNKRYKTGVNPADDLLTTVEDLCKFGIYVMNGAGLSVSLFNDMVTPQSKIQKYNAQGLGWVLILDLPDNEYAIEHGGSDIGVRTESIFMPESKSGIVVFTNGDNGLCLTEKIVREYFKNGELILDHLGKIGNSIYNGQYVFILFSNDGSRMFLGDKLIIDNDGVRATQNIKSFAIPLEKGFYPVRIEYFSKDEGSVFQLFYLEPNATNMLPFPLKQQYYKN